MNTPSQRLDPLGIAPTSDSSSNVVFPSIPRAPARLTTWMGLLVGLLFSLFSTTSARADRVPANCTGSGLGINLFTSIPDVHIGDTLFYSVNVFNGIPNSGRIVCDAVGITAFIVTPDGKTNNVTLVRTTLHQGEADFYPDVVAYVVRAQDIQPDGTLLATARDIGVIHQNDTDSIGGGFQGVNTEVNLPCVLITALCVGGVGENGLITFTGTVTNCGNNTLVGVVVTNFHDLGNFTVLFPTNLAIGQSANFSGSFLPANPCVPSTAILTVRASDDFSSTPRVTTNFTTVTCQNTLTPGIKVTKVCPVSPVSPGQLLVYSGSVSNSGNVTLTNIVVLDNQPAPNTPVFTLASLAPGAVANFTGSYTAPTACSVSDTLTATASSRCGVGVSSVASVTCPILTTPQIVVTATCPVTPVLSGGTLVYSGTVRNTGNTPMVNVQVVSDRPAANTTVFTIASLAPGATANFTSSLVVPVNACAVATTFTGSGKDNCSTTVAANTVTTTCPVSTAPAIVVTLACPATAVNSGAPINYSGTVRNSGNVTLNNVFVVNNQPGFNTPVIGPITLAPGASANFTATFTTPGDSCSVSSTVNATGNDNCTGSLVSNSASATCALITTPSIVVTQNCPFDPTAPGGLLIYNGTVRNAGNITLTNIVVLNNLSGSTPVFTATTLAPGGIVNFSGSYLASTNCASTSVSTATARSVCGVAVTGSVSSTCTIFTSPQMVVAVNCPLTAVVPGGSLTYTGTVRNTGNITLTNVVVVSDRPTANTTVFTVAGLAPGASASFTGTVTAPPSACAVTTTFSGTAKDMCTLIALTNTVATTCTVLTAPAITVTLACPAIPASSGGAIIYAGTVRNSGNVVLNNVFVVNNQPAPNTTVIGPLTLAPGAVSNFTATFTAPSDACSVTSTVVATGNDNCTAALVSNSASATCALTSTPGIVVTQICPVSSAIPGFASTYSGTVRNSGNITLTNVIVLNNLSGSTPIFTIATLAPGGVVGFTGSYLTPTNCSTTSTSTATGRSICGVAVSNSATATCPILTTPAIAVTQTCPVIPVLPGGILTYSGTVSNAGNITLTNIIVLNNQPATNTVVFTLGTLAPGATASFTGSYQVPTNCCVVSSKIRASGQACLGVTVSDTVTRTCIVSTSPKIVITKICVPGVLRPGDLLTYSGSVSNGGNINLINVTVMNNQTPGVPVLGPIVLAPGESVIYNASYIVPPDFCGNDTVTASGLDGCTSLPVSNSINTTCPVTTAPRITVVKNCPTLPTPRGGLFTFTGSVSNPGNVTLVNVFVTDNMPTNNTPVIGPITLAPGATVNFSGSYIAPHCCCLIIDTLTARGQDRCSLVNVASTASAVCPLLTTPGITLVQNCPANPIPMGSVYSFSGLVLNTGDVVLTNVMVMGPQGTSILGPIELAPGESELYFGSYTVPFNTCSVAVTAQGRDVCAGNLITTVTSCPVATSPLLFVRQNCPAGPVSPGSLLIYSGSVSNAGNITLNNVVVTNNQSGNTPLISVATLAPGATTNFTGSYIAPATITSTSTSTARATNLCGTAVTNSASSTCSIVTQPAIAITKLCPPVPVAPGGILVFTGTVTNTGNVTLTNIFVVNNQPAPNTPVIGPITLAPGAGTNFTGGYLVPLNVCSSSDTLTGRGNDAVTGLTITNAASATCVLITTPAITITETCPPGPVTAGSSVAFSGSVINNGNITLTNVLVFSSQPGNTLVLGPITLAPGGSAPYVGSYIATGGSSPTTNTTILTNSTSTITTNFVATITTNNTAIISTNAPIPTKLGTIDSVAQSFVDRFVIGTNFNGLTYAEEDHGYGANELYTMRKDTTGASFFDTIIAGTSTTTDRFNASNRTFDSLTYAAGDFGYGPLLFYYLSHDNAGVSTFGSITPGGVVGVIADHFVVGNNFDALTFTATDVGYGANLFYYVRHDATGLSTFGTINPALPGTITDRFTVGTNVDALVFTDLVAPGFGPNNFYYLRHDAAGVSTFGTIFVTGLTTGTATDRFGVGTNANELAFAAPDLGFGANLFYILRGRELTFTTNIVTTFSTNTVTAFTTNTVTTFTTNSLVSFTPTNSVTATGIDICQARSVTAAANCLGSVATTSIVPIIGSPVMVNGAVSLSVPTENGISYTLQYKNTLNDPSWINLQTMDGTGANLPLTDAGAGQQSTRFYRVISNQ